MATLSVILGVLGFVLVFLYNKYREAKSWIRIREDRVRDLSDDILELQKAAQRNLEYCLSLAQELNDKHVSGTRRIIKYGDGMYREQRWANDRRMTMRSGLFEDITPRYRWINDGPELTADQAKERIKEIEKYKRDKKLRESKAPVEFWIES